MSLTLNTNTANDNNQITNQPLQEKEKSTSINIKKVFSAAKDYLRFAYMVSPINFSTITGFRGYYDGVKHKMGNPFLGRLVGRPEGIQNEIYDVLGKKALERPDVGLCYSWVGTKCEMLMVHPRYIDQVFVRNNEKISRSLAVENNFALGFLKHNIFTLENGKEWQDKRKVMKTALFTDSALQKLAEPMQQIIEESLNKLLEDEKPIDLDQFFCRITLDVIARTQMVADGRLADHIDEFTQAFERLLGNIFELNEILKQRWVEAIRKKFNTNLVTHPTHIENARDDLFAVIKNLYLDVYKDKIVVSDNLVTKLLAVDYGKEQTREEKACALYFKDVLGQLALTLLVGHDTTARLLHFVTRLLVRYPECLQKLRTELADYRTKHGNQQWTREDIAKLPYLQMVLREGLRLYPSAPILGYAVTQQMTLGDIPLTNTVEEYRKEMAKRDKTHDVTLYPGDIVLLASPLTHRLAEYYPNPEMFLPERWSNLKNKDDPEDARKLMIYPNTNSTFLSFGIGNRSCVGKNFAIQEASILLAKLVENYDIKIENDNIYPFPTEVIATVRPAKTEPGKHINAFFKPREPVLSSPKQNVKLQDAELRPRNI